MAEFVIRRLHVRVRTDRFYKDSSVVRNLDEECDRGRGLLRSILNINMNLLCIETQTLQLSDGHFCGIEFRKNLVQRSENSSSEIVEVIVVLGRCLLDLKRIILKRNSERLPNRRTKFLNQLLELWQSDSFALQVTPQRRYSILFVNVPRLLKHGSDQRPDHGSLLHKIVVDLLSSLRVRCCIELSPALPVHRPAVESRLLRNNLLRPGLVKFKGDRGLLGLGYVADALEEEPPRTTR